MTRMGYPLWAVQLLGRWGSETVKSYVGEAALDIFTSSSPGSLVGTDALESVLAAAGQHRPSTADSRPGLRQRAAPSDADTQRIATRVAGDLVAELGEALRAEIDLELARRIPRPAALCDASTDPAPSLVTNDRTECVHIIGVGPSSGLSARRWKSLCGWTFGRWGGFTIAGGLRKPPPAIVASTTVQVKSARRAGLAGSFME